MDCADTFRAPHLLAENRGYSCPHSFAFVDVESRPHDHPVGPRKKIHRFRLGFASCFRLDKDTPTRRAACPFWDPDLFWEWLEERYDKKRPLYLFAHNVGFDLTLLGLWNRLDSGYFRLADDLWPLKGLLPKARPKKKPWRGVLITEDPPTVIVVKHGDFTLKIVDTLNYWPVPLAVLGKDVGIDKVPLPKWSDSDSAWMIRCEADVRIIEKSVLQLVQRWRAGKYGTFRATAAGLAWNCYRHAYMNSPIEIHGHRKAMSMERASYFGGECRCFYVGMVKADERLADKLTFCESTEVLPFNLQRIYHVDSASFYPSFMERERFPRKLAGYLATSTIDVVRQLLAEHAVIAEVVIKSGHNAYPVKHKDRTRFAVGTFRTVLCGPELVHALDAGDVLETGQVVWYLQDTIFRDYIQHFWPLRRQAKELGRESESRFYKLLMNALPGKFGQRQWRWDEDLSIPGPVPWGEWYHFDVTKPAPQLYRSVACYSQKCFRAGETDDSFPAIPAYLTSYGRQFMRQIRARIHPANVFYQDTDSLILNAAGYRDLNSDPRLMGEDLGQFTVRGVHNRAAFHGLKHYELDGKLTYGAVNRETEPDMRGKFSVVRFQKLSANLAGGIPDGVSVEETTVTPCECHPDGIVGKDGFVQPLVLPSDDPFEALGIGTGHGWLMDGPDTWDKARGTSNAGPKR
jgi:hypothetical protein